LFFNDQFLSITFDIILSKNNLTMKKFQFPDNLKFNRGAIHDPEQFLKASGCVSWLCLTGEEFAAMPGGIMFSHVKAATPDAINVISDPPRTLNIDLARQHVEALDSLPRPTLVTCRMGPRSSAAAYMYAGLKAGSNPDDVLAAAEADDAPFVKFDEYKEWVRDSILTLRNESE
jgi:hypothetical protein